MESDKFLHLSLKRNLKKLQLLLTNSCSENWDEMQPSKVGRYCDTCTKHVIDLTNKSDVELVNFFKKKKTNVCGRLLSTQLDRELIVPTQKANLHWLLPVALGASIVTVTQAQEIKPTVVQQHNISPSISEFQQHTAEITATDTIRGKVIDQATGSPLVGVKISRKGFKNVIALTDNNGNFKLNLGIAERTNPLVFELNEYNRIEHSITEQMIVKLEKLSAAAPRVMIGAVTTISSSNKPLYVINAGKKSCILEDGSLKDLNPEWIESIKILKDASAIAHYGAKAANGVVLVGIKRKYTSKIKFLKKD